MLARFDVTWTTGDGNLGRGCGDKLHKHNFAVYNSFDDDKIRRRTIVGCAYVLLLTIERRIGEDKSG